MPSITKSALLSHVKRLMRKLKMTEYDIEQHYEMITLSGRTLSYLRYPDDVWTNEDIPMHVLRECRYRLEDLLP